jgi:hypothetical protein
MYKILRNQRGNIAIALALAIVGIMSGITMASLALKDTIDSRFDFESVQMLHLLRTEAMRGQVVTQLRDESGEGFPLQIRYVKVAGSHSKATYELNTKVYRENISTGGGLYFTQGYNIKTLGRVSRYIGSNSMFNEHLTIVRKYGEKGIRRNSFAGYHYFTDNEQSTNNTNVYFWGPDVIYGKVHSNTDIWLKQAGGGTNNGWPTFYGPVYTAGEIKSFSGTPPYSQVFRKDYWEHVSQLEFNPTAALIRANGATVGPSAYDPNRILFVTVYLGSYSSWLGQVINMHRDTTDVWSQYPPRAGNYMYRNNFPDIDTLWVQGPSGPSAGHSNIVFSKLWLKGRFAGAQTWCAVDTLYLTDNCFLNDTNIGQCPDGTVSGSSVNVNDYLGIVSEKSILVQYGYRDPQDSLRYRPNCEGDTQGIWIYAAMCALGAGGGDSHRDGVFSFEYQHPHPSVPAVTLQGNPYVWDQIDLHRRRFPPTSTAPWPGNIDYPWYNPLWPERFPYMERGSINLWGSVAQRRRGFVHRNTYDTEYPNPNSSWNIPEDLCGATSGVAVTDPVLGFVMQGINAPQATGGGVGYKKNYHFDNRFSFVTPPDFPEVHVKGGLTPFESEAWIFKRPPRTLN